MIYKENGIIKGLTHCPYCGKENQFVNGETGTAVFAGSKSGSPVQNESGEYVHGEEVSLNLTCQCVWCNFFYNERDYLAVEAPKR